MNTVTYPAEWDEIKRLAAASEYRAVMEFANYKETDPARIDPDEEPSFTYEFGIQSFAIRALASFSNDTVSQFLIQKFNGYQDDFQKCDVLESLAHHRTEIARTFLLQVLETGNGDFREAIVNGIDEAGGDVSGDMLALLKDTAEGDDEVESNLMGNIQKIIARSDKQSASKLIDREFSVLSEAGMLTVDQRALLQDLTDAAISAGYQVDLPVLDRLLRNDGSEWNATMVARLVYSYPDSEEKKNFIAELQETFFDYDGMMGELGLGLE